MLLIEGDAGLGKSRLLAAARSRAAEGGMRVLTAYCSELEQGFTFGVARQLIGDAPEETLGGGWEASGLGTIVSLYERVLALAKPGPEPVPLLVAVDDAQWADEPSLRFIAHLALRIEDLPVAIVMTVRTGEPMASGELFELLRASRSARELAPEPLSATAVATMARTALGDRAEGLAAACFRASGGNPFYLSELLRTLEGEPTVSPEQVGRVAPTTVLRAIVVRLARLGGAASSLAGAVAVLGDGTPLRSAAALAQLDELAAEEAADTLARGRILVGGDPLRFTHPLIASALEADMGAFERARKHRRAAELLLGEGAPVERVAAHLAVARPEGDQAVVDVLEDAAERAMSSGAPAAAARLLDRALAEPPDAAREPELLLACAKAEILAGSQAAEDRLERALQGIEAADRRAEALGELATLAALRWDHARAADLAIRAQSLLEPEHPLQQQLLGIELSATFLHPDLIHRMDERIAPVVAEVGEGRAPSDPRLLAVVTGWVGVAGPPGLVRRLADAAIEHDPLIDQSHGTSLGWVSAAVEWVDEFEFGERWLTDAIAAGERRGAVIDISTALCNRARMRLLSGRLRESVADGERALEIFHLGWTGSPWSTPALAVAYTALGQLDAAESALEIGLRSGTNPPDYGRLLEAEAWLRLAQDKPKEALETACRVAEFLSDRGIPEQPRVWEWRRLAALAAHRLGDDARALELVEPDLHALRSIGPARPLGEALTITGLALGGRDGLDVLCEAATVLEGSPARLQRAETLLAFGAAQRRAGARTSGQQSLYAALELAAATGAAPLEKRIREELGRLGLRPRRTAQAGLASLTASERQVAELAAGGLTTPQIAARLHISRHTVDTHLRHIYQKLDVAGRHQLPEALSQDAIPAS